MGWRPRPSGRRHSGRGSRPSRHLGIRSEDKNCQKFSGAAMSHMGQQRRFWYFRRRSGYPPKLTVKADIAGGPGRAVRRRGGTAYSITSSTPAQRWKHRSPPVASRETSRMLAFAPFQGFIRECQISCRAFAAGHLKNPGISASHAPRSEGCPREEPP